MSRESETALGGSVAAAFVMLTLSTLCTLGCQLFPDCTTQPGSVTKLVTDSADVRRMLATAAERDEKMANSRRRLSQGQRRELFYDMEFHPERYMVERKNLIVAMAAEPGRPVPGKQGFRILEQSPAGCANDPFTTSNYLRVRVLTGPSKGSEGWACSRDVQPTGWFVM